MKNPNQSICEPGRLVNHPVQDVWIEGYLEALERWRIQANSQGIVLVQLRRAWRAYGKYRTSADRSFRRSAWDAIQATAAALRT
jgi:hypothetical protein